MNMVKDITKNPVRLAHEVVKTVSAGKLVNLRELSQKVGYSRQSAISEKGVRTQKYKQTIASLSEPLLKGLQEQINKIKYEIANRNLKNEEYRTLVGSLDILIKNYQLLSGGATERQIFVLPSEVMERNQIANTSDVE